MVPEKSTVLDGCKGAYTSAGSSEEAGEVCKEKVKEQDSLCGEEPEQRNMQ